MIGCKRQRDRHLAIVLLVENEAVWPVDTAVNSVLPQKECLVLQMEMRRKIALISNRGEPPLDGMQHYLHLSRDRPQRPGRHRCCRSMSASTMCTARFYQTAIAVLTSGDSKPDCGARQSCRSSQGSDSRVANGFPRFRPHAIRHRAGSCPVGPRHHGACVRFCPAPVEGEAPPSLATG